MAFREEDEEEETVTSDSDPIGDEDDEYKDSDEDFEVGDEKEEKEERSSDEERKSQNVDALVRGSLVVRRQPLIPRVLSVTDGAAVARKPFKPPCSKRYKDDNELTRRLWTRKKFVPWGSSRPVLVPVNNLLNTPSVPDDEQAEINEPLPPGIEPLVLWQPERLDESNEPLTHIVVDPLLVRYLRPHQREGVQFMFDCVAGLSSAEGVSGCILADDMGLGKTLQSITLLYTLLHQGFDGKPMVKRALVVTPTSLVSNWESEINKWVDGRVQLLALCESTRADVLSGIDSFLRPRSPLQVLIISYETFRMHSSNFEKVGCCDLLICDEAHRLKNDQTLINRALAALPCTRRILLSGTPMQNDLEEFFAMVNFTNPGVLGDATYFRRYYETPIICGREPTATIEERKLGAERSSELSAKVNQFILRRSNALLSNHLPPKIVQVVCCKLTPLQLELYNHFIQSKNVRRAIAEDTKQSKILAYITALKKLCNHPKLIYDTIKSGNSGTTGFEDCLRFFSPELFSASRTGSWTGGGGIWVELSGKMHVLARLLGHLHQKTDDRIVLVSNYTQTLDLFAQLCRERRYPYVRLDGTTSIGKRQKLVNRFNDPSKDEFVFLLSSKAGGCGLNLIGGNRLVLFDPDWNPANDKQAAARVWRDGQKKRVYIYRFLSTGTIEEKVYQRQMSKEGLQKVIQQEQADSETLHRNLLSTEDLRDLFTLHEHVRSEIHENMNCPRCPARNEMTDNSTKYLTDDYDDQESTDGGLNCGQTIDDIGGFAEMSGCLHKLRSFEKQIGTPLEEDLGSWGHHTAVTTVPDEILQASAGDEVTFVFTNQVDGKLVPVESAVRSTNRQLDGQSSHVKKENRTPSPQLLSVKSPESSGNFARIIPTFRSKLPRTSSSGIPALRNPKLPRQTALKRVPATSNATDDDFM